MNKLKPIFLICGCLGAMSAAYALGYYNGTLTTSYNHTGFDLAVDEGFHDALLKNDPSSVEHNLKLIISGESRSMRAMKNMPVRFFFYEMKTATPGPADEIAKRLQKADEITKE